MSKSIKHTTEKGNTYEISGGEHTGYGFKNSKGEKSILGFDSKQEAKIYLDKRDNGDKHFIDK